MWQPAYHCLAMLRRRDPSREAGKHGAAQAIANGHCWKEQKQRTIPHIPKYGTADWEVFNA
eukprot:7740338-Pyramimonas_sp.AAC.1